MISPELLRRYPFFGFLNEETLKIVAMHTEEALFASGATILQEGHTAEALYFLLEGSVDLYYTLEEAFRPELSREFRVGEVNPGEPFGISACIEPHILTSTARATKSCRVIRIEAAALLDLCKTEKAFAYNLMKRLAMIAMQRLNSTRVQLAAAWA